MHRNHGLQTLWPKVALSSSDIPSLSNLLHSSWYLERKILDEWNTQLLQPHQHNQSTVYVSQLHTECN